MRKHCRWDGWITCANVARTDRSSLAEHVDWTGIIIDGPFVRAGHRHEIYLYRLYF